METIFKKDTPEALVQAGKLLAEGELVVIPTETVYGLGADAMNRQAVLNIFKAKGRPQDNPLIVHICEMKQLEDLCQDIPESAYKLAEAFWPGPLTMILKRKPCVPDEVTAGLDTVAVRMPSHPAAREIIRQSGTTIAAPSANLSGKPSPTRAQHAYDDLNGRVAMVVDGGPCQVGVESTVITLAGDHPVLLRPGGVTVEQLEAVIGPVVIHSAVTDKLKEGQVAASPGMKYKHYAPKAQVILLEGTSQQYVSYVNAHAQKGVVALCYDEEIPLLTCETLALGSEKNSAEHAHRLFSDLRTLDEMGCHVAYGHLPEKTGVELAVYNRLIRAAGYETVKLS